MLFHVSTTLSIISCNRASEWMPSKKSYTSSVSSKGRMIMFLGKTFLFFLDVGMDFAAENSVAPGVFFLLFNIATLWWVAYTLPYHRWQVNLGIIVFMSITTVEGFLRMILKEANAD